MDSFYESRYLELEKNWWFFKARRELILQLIKDIEYSNVIEIGCGSGILSKDLKNYAGIDISKQCKNIRAVAEKLPIKDESFDLILLLDILEHTDHKVVMEEVLRISKPYAKIIITVPGFMFLWTKFDEDNHHRRRYNRYNIPIRNFNVVRFTYWNSILFPIMLLMKRKKIHLTEIPVYVNSFLTRVLRLENYLISKKVKLPIGVTLVYILSNNKTN